MFDFFSKNPFELDWGKVTPEQFSYEKKEALHIFNFDISSTDKIIRCFVFSVGKIIWTNKHLPKNTKQKVVFDLRGQPITYLERARNIRENILQEVAKTEPDLIVNIEILI